MNTQLLTTTATSYPTRRTISTAERAIRQAAQLHADRYIAFTMTANSWYAAGNYATANAWDKLAIQEKRQIPAQLQGEADRMYVSAHIKQLTRQ